MQVAETVEVSNDCVFKKCCKKYKKQGKKRCKNCVKKVKSELIYKTNNCAVMQCDATNKLELSLFGVTHGINVCSLLAFKGKVLDFNIESLLYETSHDVEIISFGCINRVMALNAHEIIELRELVEGTFAMLELNTIVNQSLVRKLA